MIKFIIQLHHQLIQKLTTSQTFITVQIFSSSGVYLIHLYEYGQIWTPKALLSIFRAVQINTVQNTDCHCVLYPTPDAVNFIWNDISSAVCTGLKETWSNVVTETVLPVEIGTIVNISCMEGYLQDGDKQITCTFGGDFSYQEEPTCGKRSYNYTFNRWIKYSCINHLPFKLWINFSISLNLRKCILLPYYNTAAYGHALDSRAAKHTPQSSSKNILNSEKSTGKERRWTCDC